MFKHVAIIGGCGHVGLPLGVRFATSGIKTTLVDINQSAVDTVMSGRFPFLEKGGDLELEKALANGLEATTDTSAVKNADVVVFVIGTPVDEHLNPKLSDVVKTIEGYRQYIEDETLVIMRSTLYPGTMEYLKNRLSHPRLAFCPERVSQGYALEEIDTLPQIVSAFDDESFQLAADLFAKLAPSIIKLTPLEAEMTKLMANSWRYLEFAIANQFYVIAEKSGLDFYRVFDAIKHDYPRAKGYKSPGFAAGPCLFKDTMQLAAYFDHQFYLGHSAMLVNEGLATFVVEKTKQELGDSLWNKKVGILGMTFKAGNDDVRESLSFKVKKALEFSGAEVIWHDPFLDGSFALSEVTKESDAIVLCTPHEQYAKLNLTQPVVDVWGTYKKSEIDVYQSNEFNKKAGNE